MFNLDQSSSDKLIIESSKVGIGKTDPITALDISGVVRATSFFGNGTSLTGIVTNPAISDVNLNSKKITNLAPPTTGTDAVNMDYVDNQVVAAGGGGSVIEFSCAWRYDYREGSVAIGSATNWSCAPPTCPSGWTDAGVVSSEPTSVACPGNSYCSFNDSNDYYHPVTVGRSVRYCFR